LNENPNRTDIWSLFLDFEISAKRYDEVRNIFERVCSLKLSSKKMKNFLKRFITFEEKYGDEDGVNLVKQIAKKYVDKNNF
jgi:rRNA biogenesis protein RRP5